jgi:hypothetical protein
MKGLANRLLTAAIKSKINPCPGAFAEKIKLQTSVRFAVDKTNEST